MLNSDPDVGDTENVPGTGGPFVLKAMAAFDSPQVRVNVSVEYNGSDLGASTKFTVLTLPGCKLTEMGVEVIFGKNNLGSSTLHSATAPAEELPMLTVLLRSS